MPRVILCLGSNYEPAASLAFARLRLQVLCPGIRFAAEVRTAPIGMNLRFEPFLNQVAMFTTDAIDADAFRLRLKQIERQTGRAADDKAREIVRLDIDLLAIDDHILKPADWQRAYVRQGVEEVLSLNDGF